MNGAGDKRMAEAVGKLLAEGPLDVLELLAGLRRTASGLLGKQEGAIHAWLRGAVRAGTLTLAGRTARGLTRYGRAGSDTGAAEASDTAGDAAPSPVASDSLAPDVSRRALLVVRGVKDEADRGRIMIDVAAHIEHLAKAKAGAQFGPLRLARTLLQRTDRGRGTVCFAGGFGDRVHRFLRHEGPWVFGAVVAFLVLRQFVVEVYVIPSESMRTCLEVGDRVVVLKRGDPERWRVFVFEGEGKSIVKRIVALGGDEIAVFQGDVYIDGKLAVKPDDVRAALRRKGPRWRADGGTLVDWDRRMAHGEATWSPRNWPSSGDHWFDPAPTLRATGPIALYDGYLEVEIERPAAGRVSVSLGRGFLNTPGYEGAVEWTLAIQDAPGDARELVIEERRDGVAETATLLRAPAPPPGATTLALSFVDGILRASAGKTTFKLAREAPYHPLQTMLSSAEGTQIQEIALDRDVHYSHDGVLGVPNPAQTPRVQRAFRVPDGHVFFLGDNTRNSEDSRFKPVGPIPHERLVGPVVYRILPPSRIGRVR